LPRSLSQSALQVIPSEAKHFHDKWYRPSILDLLWTTLPFIASAAVAYIVRRFRFSCAAVALVIVIQLLLCLPYRRITDQDEMPFFMLGLTPFMQLFIAVAFLAPVLTGTWYAHQRRKRNGKSPSFK
jgi:hypothetical protein